MITLGKYKIAKVFKGKQEIKNVNVNEFDYLPYLFLSSYELHVDWQGNPILDEEITIDTNQEITITLNLN